MNDNQKRLHRQIRSRKKTAMVTNRPRLSVFRSNNYVYAQIIDIKGNTIVGISEKVVVKSAKAGSPIERAKQVGAEIAKLALAKKVKEVAFDKGRFAYHGRVKAVAEGAREGGLTL
ncbi:MAG TPA: 50S ribosomal protein L18 [Candidatus Saccharimonadales bacterium]|nr:50S ribosomal protein L18 [Candidatus Saccharimonadales bacterium]